MNRFVYALLLIGLVCGCHKKMTPAQTPDKLLFEQHDRPYEVITIKRTSCFGKCPAYEAGFWSDGKVTYKGIGNVEKRGNYVSQVKTDVINNLLKKAFEIKYFEMEDKYPVDGDKIADLPSTITTLNCIGQAKKITNRYRAPKELEVFEKMIDAELDKLHYKSTDSVK